ncbi:hypothetical protein KM043_013210 [Ampulex compressa]|nr:hypothetical protein KM043_013210 [Ampulex compressa]
MWFWPWKNGHERETEREATVRKRRPRGEGRKAARTDGIGGGWRQEGEGHDPARNLEGDAGEGREETREQADGGGRGEGGQQGGQGAAKVAVRAADLRIAAGECEGTYVEKEREREDGRAVVNAPGYS